MECDQTEVIIVGAGGSGLAAAVSCAERGFKTVVLETCAQPGGTTSIAIGSFTAAKTEFQRKQGIHDSAKQHALDLGNFAPQEIEVRNNDTQRAFFTKHAADTLAWLESHGIQFVGPAVEPPNTQPRMHNVIPGAKAYIARLQLAAHKRNVEIRSNAKVYKLLTDGARVSGVVYETTDGRSQTLRAERAVILAAGDYANNTQLIKRFKGPGYENIEGINPNALGLGHLLAESVGAKLINMDVTYGPELRFIAPAGRSFQQWLPATGPLAHLQNWMARFVPEWLFQKLVKRLMVTWQHPEDTLFQEGAILVNRNGNRFCDETNSKQRNIAVSNQATRQAYVLLSVDQIEKFSKWPHYISTAPDIAYAYVDDYLRLRPDISFKSSTIQKLAQKVKLPLDCLTKTVNLSFGTAKGPWVLLGPVQSYFTTTEGSPALNEQLQVLDKDGKVINGLYAVGQCGLNGMILWSHGCHIAWAMTSGRLVGESIDRQRKFPGA